MISLIRKLILPSMSKRLFQMSIERYSNEVHPNVMYSKSINILLLFLTPLIGLYMMSKSVPMPNKKKHSLILCEAISIEYKNDIMSSLVKEFKDKDIRYIGRGLDCDGLTDNQFLSIDSWRIIFTAWLAFPFIFLLTLFGRVSLASALVKTLVVYYRARRFFEHNSANIFLTIRDNSCSPALYSSFIESGGVKFCAIQNGVRLKNEEWAYSYFDHLFAINKKSVEMYKSIGSVIHNFDVVPTQSLDNFLKLKEKVDINIDILFIDQGFPINGLEMWQPVSKSEEVLEFLTQVKRFSIKHKELKLVYLMRRYDESQKYVSEAIEDWAKHSNIILEYPCNSNESYNIVSRSKLVVTMYSTLGLEALSLGVNALFFNSNRNNGFDTCVPPYQHKLRDYQYFENTILNVSALSVAKDKKILDDYVPPTINGSKLIANKINDYARLF